MKIIAENELEKAIREEKFIVEINEDIDEISKKILTYYSFLKRHTESTSMGRSKEDININRIYSKYYWYNKYKKRYFEIYGYDTGIEQEELRLLEEMENELDEDIDWTLIQRIEESKE